MSDPSPPVPETEPAGEPRDARARERREAEALAVVKQAVESGGPDDPAQLFVLLADDLHRMAKRARRARYGSPSLHTTDLVHEAYLRIVEATVPVDVKGEQHFIQLALLAMRHILIDRHRRRSALRRGGGRAHEILDEAYVRCRARRIELDQYDAWLHALRAADSSLALVVELVSFLGWPHEQVATLLEVSTKTIQRRLQRARRWLLAHDPDAGVLVEPAA